MRRRVLLIAALVSITLLGARLGHAQVVIAPVSCWQGTTYFSVNPFKKWLDYCHWSDRHGNYVVGALECYRIPVEVCSVFVPPTCPPRCAETRSCPAGCTVSGQWTETQRALEPQPFPCPDARRPPTCWSTFTRTSVSR